MSEKLKDWLLWGCMGAICFLTLAVVLLWNSRAPAYYDTIGVSLTILEIFVTIAAIGGFFSVSYQAKAKAGEVAEKVAKEEARKVAELSAREAAEEWCEANKSSPAPQQAEELANKLDKDGNDARSK